MEFTKDLIVVCTTVDSIKEARSISRILVEEKLAACIQINQVRSILNGRRRSTNALSLN